MKKEIWYKIPEFPNYEVNNEGVARHINGKLLKMYQYKGYSLLRNGEQRYIRPPRLLYAALHGVSPVGVKDIVVLNIDDVLTPMTRMEYAKFINKKRRYGTLGTEEAIEYYKKNIHFSQMMLKYYQTGDMASIVNELYKYENYVKSYIRRMLFSSNENTINESWDEIFSTIISKIHDGCISIIEPRSYLLKCVRIYFKELRKVNRNIIRFQNCNY